MKNDIEKWIDALDGHSELEGCEWVDILVEALDDPPVNPDDYNYQEAISTFEKAADEYRVSGMDLDFPDSTHGDGVSVGIFYLPNDTFVMTKYSTCEINGNAGLVLSSTDVREIYDAAWSLLFDDVGDHPIHYVGEEDPPEDDGYPYLETESVEDFFKTCKERGYKGGISAQ